MHAQCMRGRSVRLRGTICSVYRAVRDIILSMHVSHALLCICDLWYRLVWRCISACVSGQAADTLVSRFAICLHNLSGSTQLPRSWHEIQTLQTLGSALQILRRANAGVAVRFPARR